MDPYVARDAALEHHRAAALAVEPRCDALRGEVVGMDQRDQVADARATAPPVAYGTRRFGRIALAPVAAEERPPELRLRMRLSLGDEAVPPEPRVPDDVAGTADERVVGAPQEEEVADPVRAPAVPPALDHLLRGLVRDAAEEP